MPSKDRENRLRRLLDEPGLSPTQAKDIEQNMERFGRNEDARFVDMAHRDIAAEDVRLNEAETRLKEFVLNDVTPRVEEARKGRLTAREIAALRDEVQQAVAYFEGGADKQGVLASLDAGYDRAHEVLDDPGAAADAFWRKWGGGSLDRWSARS